MDKPIQPPLLIFEFMYNNSNPFLWFQSSSIFVLLPVIIPFFFFLHYNCIIYMKMPFYVIYMQCTCIWCTNYIENANVCERGDGAK